MAEYHYYGHGGQRNLQKAADLYCNAAISGDRNVEFYRHHHIGLLSTYTID